MCYITSSSLVVLESMGGGTLYVILILPPHVPVISFCWQCPPWQYRSTRCHQMPLILPKFHIYVRCGKRFSERLYHIWPPMPSGAMFIPRPANSNRLARKMSYQKHHWGMVMKLQSNYKLMGHTIDLFTI